MRLLAAVYCFLVSRITRLNTLHENSKLILDHQPFNVTHINLMKIKLHSAVATHLKGHLALINRVHFHHLHEFMLGLVLVST